MHNKSLQKTGEQNDKGMLCLNIMKNKGALDEIREFRIATSNTIL